MKISQTNKTVEGSDFFRVEDRKSSFLRGKREEGGKSGRGMD